ncbi:ABC transporter ATP-binding protein [Heliorestis acidaminivorans]|uniref:ABC transporter ATP-binding protein n=1 Tax=Heliorestis acidaminivorans TaxID=553427 RepID=A0A6I0EQY9_9FIRM|nr:ABC transporter ATP-binding protein [Heliorestis acidaminivorans]
MTEKPLIFLDRVNKVYSSGEEEIFALREITVEVEEGEFVAIMGSSGSGKSTMMNLLGCLDKPTKGDYYLDKQAVAEATEDELALIRNKKIGFVFQNFNLLPKLSALENVELPLLYSGMATEERRQKAENALEAVGLSHRKQNKPTELSGGQQQRVSIARALVNEPVILLADEPTGALDSRTTTEIMEIFQELHQAGKTIMMVTHEAEIAEYAERLILFRDGMIVDDNKR